MKKRDSGRQIVSELRQVNVLDGQVVGVEAELNGAGGSREGWGCPADQVANMGAGADSTVFTLATRLNEV